MKSLIGMPRVHLKAEVDLFSVNPRVWKLLPSSTVSCQYGSVGNLDAGFWEYPREKGGATYHIRTYVTTWCYTHEVSSDNRGMQAAGDHLVGPSR